MNPIARALAERSPRERAVLSVLGAAVAIALLLAFAWLPLERARTRLATELPAMRASIALLEQQAEEAKRLRAMPSIAERPAGDSLAQLAAGGARPLAGAQVSVLDPRTVSVTGSDVGFGALVEWLASVQASQGLRVESAKIEALGAPGRVRAELRLTRS